MQVIKVPQLQCIFSSILEWVTIGMSLGDHATLTITFPEASNHHCIHITITITYGCSSLEHSFLWIRVKKGIRPPLLCLLVVILAR